MFPILGPSRDGSCFRRARHACLPAGRVTASRSTSILRRRAVYSKSRHLYGLSRDWRTLAGAPFVILEGYMDVVTCHQLALI